MKKTKKFLSLLLAIVLLTNIGIFSVMAADIPTVYIRGQGQEIYSADGKTLYENGDVPFEDQWLEDAIENCFPLFVKSLVKGKWNEYADMLLSYWAPVYKDLILDNNGNPSNGAGIKWTWDKENLKPDFDMHSYYFGSDWRLDPYDNAAILDRYIDDILEVTGAKKVNVVARCEGTNIIAAYFDQFGYEKINCVELYVSALNGVDMVGAVFSGDIVINDNAINDLVNSQVKLKDKALDKLIKTMVNYMLETYSYDIAVKMIRKNMPIFYDAFVNRLLLTSYATFPGIWSLVGPDYYAKARRDVFKGHEEEYAGLIEKLDHYDTNIRSRVNELLLDAKTNGVKIAVIAKYGDYAYETPFCKEAEKELNDNTVCLRNAAFGVYCSDKNKTLSDEYIMNSDPSYISPDKRIDLSTCLFPDTTWIIYNCPHENFSSGINSLLSAFFESDGNMTNSSDSGYPAFLRFTGNSLVNMTEEDATIINSSNKRVWFKKIKSYFAFIKALFEYMRQLVFSK